MFHARICCHSISDAEMLYHDQGISLLTLCSQGVSKQVWEELEKTMQGIQKITERDELLGDEESNNSRLAISNRVPLVDPINVLQANVMMRLRQEDNPPKYVELFDAFAITVQGVAAGMGWTG